MASALFLLEVSSRFRHDGDERSGVRLRGSKVVPSATHAAHGVFLEHVLLSACRVHSGELCRSPIELASYH